MRQTFSILLLVISLLTNAQNPSNQFIENTVRVKFKPGLNLKLHQNEKIADVGSHLKIGKADFDNLSERFQATNLKRVFPVAGKFESRHIEYGLHLWYDIKVASNTSVNELIQQFGSLDIISAAEPVSIYSTESGPAIAAASNDPRLYDQWHYNNLGQTGGTVGADISLFEAWEVESGSPNVIVSVHDSGLDIYHPDIQNRLWKNTGEIPNDGIDNDNNGFIDDYYGYNFAAAVVGGNPSDVFDFGGHGTHTSGTIAAQNNNNIGVAGIAGGSTTSDGVRIMTLRLGDDSGSPYIYNPAPSFVYAADMGSVISSNSWGGGGYDQSIVDAINYYTNVANSSALNGGLVIFAAGNSSSSSQDYKADLPNVMMVAATNHNDQKSWYSNYGTWVDISAPGGETSVSYQGVLSTLPYENYGYYQGTSMACPHVSGVAALLASKAYGTGLTNTQLFDALISTTDPIDNINPSYSGQMGSGRLNAEAALEAVGFGGGEDSGELIIDPLSISTEIQDGKTEVYNIRLANTTSYEITTEIEKVNNADWVTVDAANLTIPANSVAKFNITLSTSDVGVLLQESINFTYPSFDSKLTRSLPISMYTLGDPIIASVDTLSFPDTYKGYSSSRPIYVYNQGTDYLEITEATTHTDVFSIEFEPVTLAPGYTHVYNLTFSPVEDSTALDSIAFMTNSPGQEEYMVLLEGYGKKTDPPLISVDPVEISIIEDYPDYNTTTFTVTNTGGDPLEYYIQANPSEYLPLSSKIEQDKAEKTEKAPKQDADGAILSIGDVKKYMTSPVQQESGIAWDGNYLWIRDASSPYILHFDPETETILDSIVSIADQGVRLDFYNGYLYEHDYQNRIIKYNTNGEVIAEISLNSNEGYTYGFSVGKDGIWLANYNNYFINLDSETGQETSRYYSSYANYSSALETFGNSMLILRSNSRLYSTSKGNSGYQNSGYIGGYSYTGIGDLSFDGNYAWAILNDYDVLVKVDVFSDFTYLYDNYGYLEAGQSETHTIEYNLYSFSPGHTYYDELVITSNSTEKNTLTIPVSAKINGTPVLEVSEDRLSFDAYIGYEAKDTLILTNPGSEELIISSITTSGTYFQFNNEGISLAPYERYKLPISINLTETDTIYDTLRIVSNYAALPVTKVSLSAIGYLSPSVSIDVESFDITLYESQIDSLPVVVTNSGMGDLTYYFENNPTNPATTSAVLSQSHPKSVGPPLKSKDETPKNEQASYIEQSSKFVTDNAPIINTTPIEKIRESLIDNFTSVNSLIPSRYDFYDGEYGHYINDGGGDMYDGGNYLSTENGGYVDYTNGALVEDYYLFGGGSYFTAKFPGLFVLSADLQSNEYFEISGSLGADGSGSVDAAVLSLNLSGVEYLGFVKRVYNAGDPSVNHLIIVPNNGEVTSAYDTYSNNDYHSLSGLNGIPRLHYLLFAGQSGAYIDNGTMLEIMEAYLDATGESTRVQSIEPNSSITEYVQFNSSQLDTGDYQYDVVLYTNDPENNKINIPTSLTVSSAPVLSTEAVLDFGEIYVGERWYLPSIIYNQGSKPLVITDYDSSGYSLFNIEYVPDTIPVDSYDYLHVSFLPDAVSSYSGTITLNTNDPLREVFQIDLLGSGRASSIMELSEFYSIDSMAINSQQEVNIEVKSTGTDSLNFRMIIEEYPSFFEMKDNIEQIRVKSGVYNGSLVAESAESISGETLPERIITNTDEVAGIVQSTGATNILLLASEYYHTNILDVIEKLDSTGAFSTIHYINLRNYYNLELSDLYPFDAVMVWGNYSFQNNVELGNILADYVDAGGGVVTAAFQHDNKISGRWMEEYEKYTLFNDWRLSNSYDYTNLYLDSIPVPSHPLLYNVDTLNSGYYGIFSDVTIAQISDNAELVATWNHNIPLIVASTDEAVKRVDLGFHPVSSDVDYGYWPSNTDGAQILVNAINYVSGGIARSNVDWVTADTYTVDGLKPGTSQTISFTVNTEGFEEGWNGARALFYSNDSRGYTNAHILNVFSRGTPELIIPDSIDFENVSFGFSASKKLTVHNQGNGGSQIRLELDSLSPFKSPWANDTLTVAAYSGIQYLFNFTPTTTGLIEDEAILHDLTSGTSKTIRLQALVQAPGDIRIEPSLINIAVDYQGSTASGFYIHNDGEGDLNFALQAFRLPGQLSQLALNNTSPIEFAEVNKGETDNRSGHPVTLGMGEDVYGYTFIDSKETDGPQFTWNDISQDGVALDLGDDESTAIDLNFEFPLYGLRHTKAYISSNGFVGFGDTGNNNPINRQIPSGSAPNGVIAPFWKDLAPQNGGLIHYLSEKDKLIVQFTNVHDYENSGSFTFQMVLHISGDIQFFYNDMNGKTTDATVGIEHPLGNQGLQIAFNTEYISNQLAIQISSPTEQISPEVTKGSVTPGDSLLIPFAYNSLNDLGGHYERFISILSNDTVNNLSSVDINVEVLGVASISAYSDTLRFDSTFISQQTEQLMWFRNDSVGVLRIENVSSENKDFSVLFPNYSVNLNSGVIRYNLTYSVSSDYVNGWIEGITNEVISIKLYSEIDNEKRLFSNLNWTILNDSTIAVSGRGYADRQLMQKEEVLIEVFTSAQPGGIGAQPFSSIIEEILPNQYSRQFFALYYPTSAESDTTVFTVESNAINTDFKVHGFGTGLKSNASFELNVSELTEVLNVNDSSEQVFVVANTGVDSLWVNMSITDRAYDSEFSPIEFEAMSESTVSEIKNNVGSRISDLKYSPTEHTPNIEAIDSEIEVAEVIDTEFFGLFYPSYSSSGIYSGQTTNPEVLMRLQSAGVFAMAAEFVYQSQSQIISVDEYNIVSIHDLSTGSTMSIGNVFGDDFWTGMTTNLLNGQMYLCTSSSLYKFEIDNMSVEYIGSFSHDKMIGIAMNRNGDLYGYTRDDEFVEINTLTGSTSFIGSIGFNAEFGQDLAYDIVSDDIYMAAFNATTYSSELRIVNIETGYADFIGYLGENNGIDSQMPFLAFPNYVNTGSMYLSLSDTVLAPGQSVDVTVGFNSTDLFNGSYEANVNFISNDYSKLGFKLPVSLEVSGNTPSVGAVTESINYGLITVMDTSYKWISIENNGPAILDIVLTNDEAGFYCDYHVGDTVSIDVFGSINFPVWFIPNRERVFEYNMTWVTNDPETNRVSINLTGGGERAPQQLDLGSEDLEVTLLRNKQSNLDLELSSAGEDSLMLNIVLEGTQSWVDSDSMYYELAPDSTVTYPVMINSNNLELGQYSTYLSLSSNDPLYSKKSIPVTLTVVNGGIESIQPLVDGLVAIDEDETNLIIPLGNYFSDIDSDSLTYTIDVNGLVETSLEKDTLFISGNSFGQDTIRVQAIDAFGDTLKSEFRVFSNTRPESSGFTEFQIRVNDGITEISALDEHFTDSDAQKLYYSIDTLANDIATISIDADNMMILKPKGIGVRNVKISAFDGYHTRIDSFQLVIDEPLSIGDELKNTLQLYPNPVKDEVLISYSLSKPSNMEIQVIDLTGKVIMDISTVAATNKYERALDLSSLKSGVYAVQFLVDHEITYSLKIIKQ
ncbi:MAG: S8 family serine peptidase [Marinoscillum sp.]